MNSIGRATSLLEAFLDDRAELTLSDIVSRSGLKSSTACVIAAELVKQGYLSQRTKRGTYSLGPKFLAFSLAVRDAFDLTRVATAPMKALVAEVNESVLLKVRDGSYSTIVTVVEAEHSLAFSWKWPPRVPLHLSSGGKVMMAYMRPSEWEDLRATLTLSRMTPNTITSWTVLEAELKMIRKESVAIDDEEHELGGRGIAAPIAGYNRTLIATLDIVGAKSRLTDERMEDVKRALKASALDISNALTGAP